MATFMIHWLDEFARLNGAQENHSAAVDGFVAAVGFPGEGDFAGAYRIGFKRHVVAGRVMATEGSGDSCIQG